MNFVTSIKNSRRFTYQLNNTVMVSEQEKRVLQNLHLRGVMGNMGAMKQRERVQLLERLVGKGLINSNCELTAKGIEASRDYKI